MKIKTVEELWQEYRDACYPNGLHPLQDAETRQAFISGMFAFSGAIYEVAEILPEDQAEKEIKSLVLDVQNTYKARVLELRSRN